MEKELLKAAKEDYADSLNLTSFLLSGSIDASLDVSLEIFGINRVWLEKLRKRRKTKQNKALVVVFEENEKGMCKHFLSAENEILDYYMEVLSTQPGNAEQYNGAQALAEAMQNFPGAKQSEWARII